MTTASQPSDRFDLASGSKGFDLEHRRKINFNMGRYHAAVQAGQKDYRDPELARDQAAYLKWQAVESLEKHLLRFVKTILLQMFYIVFLMS